MNRRRVAVTGASGFVGSALVAELRREGAEVVVISRRATSEGRPGEGRGANDSLESAMENVDGVVNLAGATIARRWTAARKREILDSRVLGTRRLAEAMARPASAARVLVCASAVGYYGNRGNEWLDEKSAPGAGFLAGVTRAWEQAADPARAAGVRVVHLRFGLVLGVGGGVLARLVRPFSLGLGGRLGDGRQWMSWIALDDLLATIRFALETGTLAGAVNAVSPSPVTNAEFTATLARVLRRPAVAHVPGVALRLVFGEMATETLLASQRVRPSRLVHAAFPFARADLDGAVRHALHQQRYR